MTKAIKEILFSRADLASILNCSNLTIGNREKSGKYPEPKRNPNNNYRFYTITDVLVIQHIEKGVVALAPIVAKLHDKGVTDFEAAQKELTQILEEFKLNLSAEKNALYGTEQ